MGYDSISKQEFDELKEEVEALSASLQKLWEIVKLFKPDAAPNGEVDV